jgi:F-type H+-transporting ATPase subunit delta
VRKREATAKRYAKALLALAREAGTGEATGQELEEFSALLAGHTELRDSLLRPWVKGLDRRAVAEAVAGRIGCSTVIKDFVGLLAERGRLDHLREISQSYRQLIDETLGRVRAHVRTAVPLDEPERSQLAEHLSRATGKTVVMENVVDPALLGGFVAQVGSLVLDGSLDGQLVRLRERLMRSSG